MCNKKIIGIACSIFQKEIQALIDSNEINLEVKFLSSMLHMVPDKLDVILNDEIKDKNTKFLLIFGDCCPNMKTFDQYDNISRTIGVNCIEIVLGKERYRKLKKEGAFFLMPEWTERWEEIFKHHLELDGEVAKEFMRDMHTKLIFIDTGYKKIPHKHLEEIKEYTGLPIEILKVTKDELKQSILSALEKFNINKGTAYDANKI